MNSQPKFNDPNKAREYFAKKTEFTVAPAEVLEWIQQGVPINVVDLREAKDFSDGHVPGARNLPKEKWDNAGEFLAKDRLNIFYSQSSGSQLPAQAALKFAEQGFSVAEMQGGFKTWREEKLDFESANQSPMEPGQNTVPPSAPTSGTH